MNTRYTIKTLSICYVLTLLCACNEDIGTAHGPIVLGDPATIVTETDSVYLRDFVADIKPREQTETTDTPSVQQPNKTTGQEPKQPEKPAVATENAAVPQTETPAIKGLNAAFNEITVSIPNINTKSYRNQDLKRANGASYELVSGNVNGNQIKISGGNVTKISQRYQTMIVVKNQLGTLPLESLSTTTDWQVLKGRNNTYTISGLDAGRLAYSKAAPAAIRNAVAKAARSSRMNRKKEQEWLNSVRHVRAANQRPLTVQLRSVIWKIEGKAANNKPYQKQLRIDFPI